MAAQLKLVRREDAVGDESSVSLLSYTDGFDVAAGGWNMAVAGEDDVPVTEVIRLRGKGSSHDNLASKFQGVIQKLFRESGDYHTRVLEPYSVWIRSQLTNESGARQALVTGVRVDKLSLYTREANINSKVPDVVVAIDRLHWEKTASDSILALNLNSLGGMSSSYGSVVGDISARITSINFTATSGDVTDPIAEVWLGIKSDRYGVTPTNFQSTWSLRLASTFGTDTTGGTSNSDSSAKDTYKTVTTFGTDATLVQRVLIKVADVTSNYADQQGSYLVLLRAKTTSTAVCRVRIGSGVYDGDNFKFNGRVVIDDTDWKLYPMGTVNIPDIGKFSAGIGTFFRTCAIRVDAERVSGAGNLELDCLILIPRDDGFAYSNGARIKLAVGNMSIFNWPNGSIAAQQYSSSGSTNTGDVILTGGIPPGSAGVLVFAGQEDGISVKADQVDVSINYVPRWLSLRGSE